MQSLTIKWMKHLGIVTNTCICLMGENLWTDMGGEIIRKMKRNGEADAIQHLGPKVMYKKMGN